MQKENSSCAPFVCFLLVACLFVTEKNVVIGRKKEGFGVEKKEFFAV